MADTTNTPAGNYVITQATLDMIEEQAKMVVDAHRFKQQVLNPAIDLKLLDKECEEKYKKARKAIRHVVDDSLKEYNDFIRETAKDPRAIPAVELGGSRIDLTSQANIDHALRRKIETADDVSKLRWEKKAYETYVKNLTAMEAKIADISKGIKAGTRGTLTDLELYDLDKLNREITIAGEQTELSKHDLAIRQHERELRVYDLRLKSKENPSSYEELSMSDDSRRVDLVRRLLGQEREALAVETKEKKRQAELPQYLPDYIPSTMPAAPGGSLPLPTIPPVPDKTRPMGPTPKLGGMSAIPDSGAAVFAAAASEVRDILAGNSGFMTDFSRPQAPAKPQTRKLVEAGSK